jgi:conjugative transfer signal peptidase TraF
MLIGGALGVRVNTSPSLPMGLYLISHDHDARFVEFCPPPPFDIESSAREYRTRGTCPDGAAPLLKPIVAKAGDDVELSAIGVSVNAILLPKTAPKVEDSKGRPITVWPHGHYRVQAGTVWVASSYNDYSYDSRYFGPISTAIIRHRLRPLWTLHSYEEGLRSSRCF